MSRLLVVEDDPLIGEGFRAGLVVGGHDVTWVRDGAGAIAAVAGRAFELVLLDLGLPDRDGLDVCRRIRAEQPATVIMILTARDEEIDIVLGLDSGADDYQTKPVRLPELLARVRAQLRRSPLAGAGQATLRVGELEIDRAARRVLVGGVDVALRAKEFDLLARLALDAGAFVSREELMSDVWDENWFGSTKTLDVHLSTLRRRLADAGESSATPVPEIVTLRGRGFRMEDPDRP